MSDQGIIDGIGNEVVYFFGEFRPTILIMLEVNLLMFSLSVGGDGGGDSLVLHLRGGARRPVSHSGGEEPGHREHREAGGDQLQHRGGGEAGRHPVPAAAAAQRHQH